MVENQVQDFMITRNNGGLQMNETYVKVNETNHIATVTIDRHPVNPLSTAVFEQLAYAFHKIEANDDIRAVILTGAGEKAFVAGADINEMKDLDLVGINQMNKTSRSVFSQIEKLTKPVIAAVNGLALGGGLELALACDLRIASSNAKFSFPEVNLGIIPGGGGTQRLQKIVGQGVAKELLFFAEMFDAERAENLGIVNKVVASEDLMNEATKWAEKLADKPPIALQMLKLAVNEGSNTNLDTGLSIENACFANAFSTEDRKEGLTAFVEKREPVYQGK